MSADHPILPPGLIPRFLSRIEAARYLGVSSDTFTAEVASGTWPQGRPRGGKGGKLTWDRMLLDREADRQSGLDQVAAAPDAVQDENELDRRIDGQTQRQRDQRRQQEAA